MAQAWEYKVITLIKGQGLFASEMKDEDDITRTINRAGAEGWELVTATGATGLSPVRLFFKRPR